MRKNMKCYRGIPYCTLGTVLGIAAGLVEYAIIYNLGFEVYRAGERMLWLPFLWHLATWAVLCYLLAMFLEQREVAKEGSKIIAEQYEKLVASQQQLMRSAKLAALGELSASMAHEIRNPLGIIRSSASLVKENFQEGDSNYRACEFITDEIDRLNELITSLLRFARAKEPVFRASDINSILSRSADFVGGELRKRHIELECRLHPGLPEATIDEDQIYQVVLELILNASRAIGDTGRIVASTEPREQGVAISISDTGGGIEAENLDRIWDPFYTTRAEGTGLGLSVVKQIVERHRGEIKVDSAPGRGTTFQILLPSLAEAAA